MRLPKKRLKLRRKRKENRNANHVENIKSPQINLGRRILAMCICHYSCSRVHDVSNITEGHSDFLFIEKQKSKEFLEIELALGSCTNSTFSENNGDNRNDGSPSQNIMIKSHWLNKDHLNTRNGELYERSIKIFVVFIHFLCLLIISPWIQDMAPNGCLTYTPTHTLTPNMYV